MKKILIGTILCMICSTFTMRSTFALENGEKNMNLKTSLVQKSKIEPRAMEQFTITQEDGIPDSDGSYIIWKATINYNPTTQKYKLLKMTPNATFGYAVFGWKMGSYSCDPSVGSDITNEDYIKITYTIITSSNVTRNFSFDFRIV